jgi:ABC-2 type transport system permease protein
MPAGLLRNISRESTPGSTNCASGKAPRASGQAGAAADSNRGMPIPVTTRDVVGENKNNKMVSFYAAAIGVMFLLFTASGAGGSLLDEAESGTLDRVLSSRVTMGTLLAGKLCYCVLLAFAQLVLMFTWAWLVFKVDFIAHSRLCGHGTLDGVCRGSFRHAAGQHLPHARATGPSLDAGDPAHVLDRRKHVPALFHVGSDAEGGLLTINAWAIDGFTKVFWRDEPVSHLWPQVLVLLAAALY